MKSLTPMLTGICTALTFIAITDVAVNFSKLATASELATRESESLDLVCIPDSPIISMNESVTLSVKVFSDVSAGLKYDWNVDDGQLEGEGQSVRWKFKDVDPGEEYVAEVKITDSSNRTGVCSVRVIVRSPPLSLKGVEIETGRSFLPSDKQEETEYGQYSYLLLGAQPTKETEQIYLRTIESYLRFNDVKEFEKYGKSKKELNITYLFVDHAPDRHVKEELAAKQYEKVAPWVLNNYSYARARLVLSKLKEASGEAYLKGPYFVSFQEPLKLNARLPKDFLFQDLTSVMPELASLWVNEFLLQSSQTRFWEPNTRRRLALNLRNALAVLAKGFPEVKQAFGEWIKFTS